MKLLLLFGPQAVGKMAIGRKIADKTGYKVVTNHALSEILAPIFNWGTLSFQKLEIEFYWKICEELAQSEFPGTILTKLRVLNSEKDNKFVEDTFNIFRKYDIPIYQCELFADFEERLRRNKTAHRLQEKPSKRDLERSEERLRRWYESESQINSDFPFGLKDKYYLKLNTTKLSVEESADEIIQTFQL
jgi:cytidylate kinase